MTTATPRKKAPRCGEPRRHRKDPDYADCLFRCAHCKAEVCGLCEGGAGDCMDGHCDACWGKVHTKAGIRRALGAA